MKHSRRFLATCGNSAIFRSSPARCNKPSKNLSNHRFDFDRFYDNPFRFLTSQNEIIRTHRSLASGLANLGFGQSRFVSSSYLSGHCTVGSSTRAVSLIPGAASNLRIYATDVGTHVKDKDSERVYVQNGGNRNEEDGNGGVEVGRGAPKREESDMEKKAWKLLDDAVVRFCGKPVGTMAANDPGDSTPLNYDQVFIRDFVPSALAYLLKGEGDIVKNFLLDTLQLQSWEKTVDCYSPGQGLMPASFKVKTKVVDGNKFEEVLDPDFGESAIGRVAPVDSGLWWIILLRAYGKLTGDYSLQDRTDVQMGLRLILNLCLTDGFDMFPSLLVTDGSCMIDRRMGIHGHPLEIQALFYTALRCSREMTASREGSSDLVRTINNRLTALSFHMRSYYWVDLKKINEIYRYKTEEYSTEATNKFNIYPDQIPLWLMDWVPEKGGYMLGNLQPAHMDFRFFTVGNLLSVISSLTTPTQNEGILNLMEAKWDDLVGSMPLKICYPAIKSDEWRIITGSDPKNTPWSYHNGGSWPTLLWQFTLACIKMRRIELAKKAIKLAEERLLIDSWPEYYDTRNGKFIGKQSRLFQTWTIAGYLTAKRLVDNPELASLLFLEEDYAILEHCGCASNSARMKCSRIAAKSLI